MQTTSAIWKSLAARLVLPEYSPAQDLEVYSGATKLFEAGNGEHVQLYSQGTLIYDSDERHALELYSGDTRVYSNGRLNEYNNSVVLEARLTIDGSIYGGADISAPVISRALTQGGLDIGNTVSASCQVSIRTEDAIPRAATVQVEIRLTDGATTSEWLPAGTFYISRRQRDPVTGLLALECYDALLKANALWTPSEGAWPRTMTAVTAELAALMGVALDNRTEIPNATMGEPSAGTTIRDALGTIAQSAGGNWVMSPDNKLRLVVAGTNYDALTVQGITGALEVDATGTVTGVRCTVDSLVTMIGDDTGIVVDAVIAPVLAAEMAQRVIGLEYQPFGMSGAIYDPAVELGDRVTGGANGEVNSVLYSEIATYGPAFRGELTAPQGGELYDEYPYIGGAERTLALARAYATEAAGQAVDGMTQQEIFDKLTDNGAAQGIILYNGQLYVNASYINAGMLNVGRINFNAPEADFDIPDESDPDSLLDGQVVANGWIVNESGSGDIVALDCRYAKLLRGRTVALTFTYNGSLSGWERESGQIGEDGQMTGEVTDGEFLNPPNPCTYTFAVPADADYFSVAFTCAGLKAIRATVSGDPVVYPYDIRFTYDGLCVGDFSVDRSGNLFGGGKNIFNGIARFNSGVYFANPGAVRRNLNATARIILSGSDNTAALIRQKLGEIGGNETATIFVSNAALAAITGQSQTIDYPYGTVNRSDNNAFHFDLCALTGVARWSFSATITSTSITCGTIYRYAGTALT